MEALRKMIRANEGRINEAVALDLRKPPFEAFFSESAYLLSEIDYALKHLDCWTQPGEVPTRSSSWAPRAASIRSLTGLP